MPVYRLHNFWRLPVAGERLAPYLVTPSVGATPCTGLRLIERLAGTLAPPFVLFVANSVFKSLVVLIGRIGEFMDIGPTFISAYVTVCGSTYGIIPPT